jgi:hypothetical protein
LLLLVELLLKVLLLELLVLDEPLLEALVSNRLSPPLEAVLVGAVRSLSNCCSTLLQNCGKNFVAASLIVARNKVGIA